jgi:uncharacterized protein YqjF (DUF2071 family)
MAMRWDDLLFAHWAVDADALARLIPDGLELETYEGTAYVGLVPFEMRGVRPRRVPPLPWLSRFPELNVRTYVRCGDRSGVWFFSLDAANPVAVRTARRWFHLPYFDARMSIRRGRDGGVTYRSRRTHRGAPAAELAARYGPIGPVARAEAGSLEAFLTDRYCLYASDGAGRIYRGEIDHPPWPLQPAAAELEVNTMLDSLGAGGPKGARLLHFSKRVDVVAWGVEVVA